MRPLKEASKWCFSSANIKNVFQKNESFQLISHNDLYTLYPSCNLFTLSFI